MIYEITVHDSPVLISINALAIPRNEKTLLKQLSEEVQLHGLKYALTFNDVFYLEEGRSLSIASKLLHVIAQDADAQAVTGLILFVIPFDNLVYIAHIEITTDYQQVIEEELVKLDDAFLKIKGKTEVLIFQCGKLTNDFLSAGYTVIEPFDINTDTKAFTFTRAKDASFLVVRLATVVAGILLVGLAVSTVTALIPKDAVETVSLSPTIPDNLAASVEFIAGSLDKFKPLLAYNMRDLGQQPGESASITASAIIDNLTPSQYQRLKAITVDTGGTLHVTRDGWFINAIPSPVSFVGNPAVAVDPIDEAVLGVLKLKSPLYQVNVGERSSGAALGNYSDYRPTVTIRNPTASGLKRFAERLRASSIKAQYLSHSFVITDGVFSAVSIQFLIRGT